MKRFAIGLIWLGSATVASFFYYRYFYGAEAASLIAQGIPLGYMFAFAPWIVRE